MLRRPPTTVPIDLQSTKQEYEQFQREFGRSGTAMFDEATAEIRIIGVAGSMTPAALATRNASISARAAASNTKPAS